MLNNMGFFHFQTQKRGIFFMMCPFLNVILADETLTTPTKTEEVFTK